MSFSKTLIAILINTIVNLGILVGWEKWGIKQDTPALLMTLLRSENALGWQILTALALAGLTALLFHSLAIPGSRAQRGIYVGIAVGILSSVLSVAPWLAKFDVPNRLIFDEMPKLFTLGIVGGIVYSLFYLKQKAAQ
jgi:MFS superfamily sulfate permease-like transporter